MAVVPTILSTGRASARPEYGVRRVARADWDGIVAQFADAGLMQTAAYGAARWSEQACIRLVIERDGRVASAAQVVVLRLPLLNSGIAHVKWGPMWRPRNAPADANALAAMLRALRAEFAERQGLVLRIYSPAFRESHSEVETALQESGFTREPGWSVHRTVCLDLAHSLDHLHASSLKPEWRRNLRRAQRNPGLTMRQGTDGELFEAFMRLYVQMQQRKRRPELFDIGYYRDVQCNLPPAMKLRVMICESQGVPVAGVAVSAIGDTALNLLAATGDAALDLRASYLLHWRMLEQLKQDAFRWYDLFGINKETTPGTYQFKTGLAGRLGHYASYTGQYQYCCSRRSAIAVSLGERVRAAQSRMGSVLPRRLAPWK